MLVFIVMYLPEQKPSSETVMIVEKPRKDMIKIKNQWVSPKQIRGITRGVVDYEK
jgi:hypothetical protein